MKYRKNVLHYVKNKDLKLSLTWKTVDINSEVDHIIQCDKKNTTR